MCCYEFWYFIQKNNFNMHLPQSRLLTGHKHLKYLSMIESHELSLIINCCVMWHWKIHEQGPAPTNLRGNLSVSMTTKLDLSKNITNKNWHQNSSALWILKNVLLVYTFSIGKSLLVKTDILLSFNRLIKIHKMKILHCWLGTSCKLLHTGFKVL